MTTREEEQGSPNTTQSRETFLLAMYSAMWDNINRHILVVWQSVGMLFAAFAALLLSEKNVLDPDLGAALVLATVFWAIAHALDASGWFNRNMGIIRNIERQFLTCDDAKHIHYFFAKGHRKFKMIEHLTIQVWLAIGVASSVLFHHFVDRVVPGFSPGSRFDILRCLPYLVLVLGVICIRVLNSHFKSQYQKFSIKSPGIDLRVTETPQV